MTQIYKSVLDTLKRKGAEGEDVYFTYLSSLMDLHTPCDKYSASDKKDPVFNLLSVYLLTTPNLSSNQMSKFLDKGYVFQANVLSSRILTIAVPLYESWKMKKELPKAQVFDKKTRL